MKIYFAGSIRGGRDDKDLYLQLIQHLTRYGEVLTEHVGDEKLTDLGDDGPSDEWIYDRDMTWLHEADVVIAEVSTPSLGVGYELGKAEAMDKQILCLYRNRPGKRLSAMIDGNPNMKTVIYEDPKDAIDNIDAFFRA